MNEIGKEYGTALFMLACEQNAQKEYAEGLQIICKAFDETPEYQQFLTSPSIPLGERLAAIETAFAPYIAQHVVSYLQLLCEKGKLFCFSDSVKNYMALLDASKHISTAKVTGATQLTEQQKQQLKEKLESICNGKVNLEYFIDETLLGGLVVEIDGKIMDGSLRHRLRQVKEVINS